MKIIFAGTPDFAATHLKKLIDENAADICAVYTQPDRPKGRGHHHTPSPVKEIAQANGIPVFQPESLKNNTKEIERIKSFGADLLVVVAYGLILPDEFIYACRLGSINVHGSILPRWRGAAPIQRSLWAGDSQAGITIMKVAPALDSGDIIRIAAIDIHHDDTSMSLYERLAELGADTLCEMMPVMERALLMSVPQDPDEVTYAHKLTKEEAFIDFREPADVLERYVRAYIPWPVACFNLQKNIIKIHHAEVIDSDTDAEPGTIVSADREGLDIATGKGLLRITELQLPNKKVMKFSEILNSRKDLFTPGEKINE